MMGAGISVDAQNSKGVEPVLTLLFRKRDRPDVDAVSAALSHSRRAAISSVLDDSAAELLIDGVTFDLFGLAPTPQLPMPPAEHQFGFDTALPSSDICAAPIVPGPHIAASAQSVVIVKAQLALVRELGLGMDVLAGVGWGPAHSIMSPAYFERVIGVWLDGGSFPALGLTSFRKALDGGIQSNGLAYFTGQEVRLEPGVADDEAIAAQLGARLVNQLVSFGTMMQTEIVTAPNGAQLRLEPSTNGRYVRVWAD